MQIDLSTADKDELERAKMILDITKIQQDLELSKEKWEADKIRYAQEQKERQARWEIERKELEAKTLKMEKESRWYPWIAIGTSSILATVISSVVLKLFGN